MSVYLSDPWNWVSTFSLGTYLVGLGLQHGQTIEYYEAARIFRAVNFMSFAYQLIRYMTVFEMWGILIPVLHRMVSILKIMVRFRFKVMVQVKSKFPPKIITYMHDNNSNPNY